MFVKVDHELGFHVLSDLPTGSKPDPFDQILFFQALSCLKMSEPQTWSRWLCSRIAEVSVMFGSTVSFTVTVTWMTGVTVT